MADPTATGSAFATDTSIVAIADGCCVRRVGTAAEVVTTKNAHGVKSPVALAGSAGFTCLTMGQTAADFLVAGSHGRTVTVWGMRDGLKLAVVEPAAANLEGTVVALAVQGHRVAIAVNGAVGGVLVVDVRGHIPGEVPLVGDVVTAAVPVVVTDLRFGEAEFHDVLGIHDSPMYIYMGGPCGALVVGVDKAGLGLPGRLAAQTQRGPCKSVTGNKHVAVVVRSTSLSIIVNGTTADAPVVTHVVDGEFVDAAVEGKIVVAIHRSGDGCILTAHAPPLWNPHLQTPVDERSPLCLSMGVATVLSRTQIVQLRVDCMPS